jgi:hypothetical protein
LEQAITRARSSSPWRERRNDVLGREGARRPLTVLGRPANGTALSREPREIDLPI